MRTNLQNRFTEKTHEGAPAARMSPTQALRRSVASCLLWEREFYEEGEDIAARILRLSAEVPVEVLADLAVEARTSFNLRHVPLLLLVALIKRGGPLVAPTIARVIQRADEPGELLSLYWKDGKRPLSKQMKKGLATALGNFDAYQLAKYNRDAAVKIRDVLFMVHAKPKDDAQAALWAKLAANALEVPDTWEVALSGGADKRETFERLIREGNLGYLALLRNLRNMVSAGCDLDLVRQAIVARKNGAHRVLPFRYVAAARAAPQLEPAIDQALTEAIADIPALPGLTAVLVDVSGSMDYALSSKSDLKRIDAAAALASIIPGNVRMFSFSNQVVEVPPRRGMAGVDAIIRSQPHQGTALAGAVAAINREVAYDRLIVITDEQAAGGSFMGSGLGGGQLPAPKTKGYMINVASAKNGVGYGPWVHMDGFSESVLRFVSENER